MVKHSALNAAIFKGVGRKIRQCRKDARISQEDFASRCGIYRSYLSRIECGLANPTISVIAKIAKELNVEIRMLFEE